MATKWWLGRSMRMVQTNLREIDAALDIDTYMRSLKEFSAEVVLFNVGGILANYPTDLPFHFRNPHLRDDLVGKVLARTRAEGIRFLARFDFSKVNETIAKDHPGWLYRSLKDESVDYNGQVHTCVNGAYQQVCSLEILGEALERYSVDGVFFNMIGYQTRDYSGNYHGICQCDSCRARFREMYGEELPRIESGDDPVFRKYEEFRRETSRELFWKITNFIKGRGESLAVVTYTHEGVDVYRKESNTGIDRPLPEWTYSASDNVKSVLASWDNMAAANTAVHFIDFPYRHSAVSPHLTAARLAGSMISGGWVDYYCIGTLEGQDDRLCFSVAKDVFGFHAANEKWFVGTRPVADVCLVVPGGSAMYGSMAEYRGLYRMLAESHVLFDAMDDSVLETPDAVKRLERYSAVVLPDVRCIGDAGVAALDRYVDGGGRILATGESSICDRNGNPRPGIALKCAGVAKIEKRHPRTPGVYLRVRPADKERLSGFEDLDILYLDSDFVACAPGPGTRGLLGYIPACMYGPPEKCYYMEETDIPGVLVSDHGCGRCAFVPWHPGAQYVRLSHMGHRRLIIDLLQDLLKADSRLITNASGLVEISAHAEGDDRWHWVGMVNHSGQLGTAFLPPVPMRDVEIKLRTGRPTKQVRALRSGTDLAFSEEADGFTSFTLPKLELFEVIVLESGTQFTV